MAGQGSGRGGLGETMAEFVRRRRRDVENLSRDAEAVAREAYGKAIRTGENLVLKTASDVKRYGADVLGAQMRPTQTKPAPPVRRPIAARTGSPPGPQWWDSEPIKEGLGVIAQDVGGFGGTIQGVVHAVEGLADGAVFLGRVANPWDKDFNPQVPTARQQLVDAGRGAVDYVRAGIAEPQRIVDDVKTKAHQMRVDLDPSATPVEATLGGELRRNFGIGMNQGELAFDVGSLVVGGPLAKGVKEAGLLSKEASYTASIADGMSPGLAEYLSKPYKGMGHHAVAPRRFKLPKVLGGGKLPAEWLNSPFNVLAPEGITQAEFYKCHFRVDPMFNHTRVPNEFKAEGWKGKKLGLKKYGLPGRVWYGTPAPFKARVGGFGAAAGGMMYADPNEGE